MLLTALLNFIYDWVFSATLVVLVAVFATVGMLFLYFIDKDWQFNPQNNAITVFDLHASVLLLFAVIVLVALAVMFSTRLNIVLTLTCTIIAFLGGLISDYVFGRFAGEHLWAKIGHVVTPNFQVFWISDAIYESADIPAVYLAESAVYAVLYTTGILMFAIAMFQKRQVG